MPISDFIPSLPRFGRRLATPMTKNEMEVEMGFTGTLMYHGILDEEFNNDLHWPQAGDVYDKMRFGDSTVQAMLAALKEPIESARHYIQPGSTDDKDIEIAEFISWNLFERICGGYDEFLSDILTFYDFGFSVFEIMYKMEDGYVVWDRFAPRLQKSILNWTMISNPDIWIDGHPNGITQGHTGMSDDAHGKDVQPEIPWEKLIVFTHKKEGINYEGKSVLRGGYKHWYYKDLLYKIQSISAERFGVGIPVAKHATGLGTKAKEKLIELAKNIRSNQQAYAVIDKNVELDILVPKGDPKSDSIKSAIDHHDRKLYDSILAGFLNLSTGDGGSNALSVDQSSFYLRSLQARSKFICNVINKHIKNLVELNFGECDYYPTLCISDIGVTNVVNQMAAIAAAMTAKAITYTPQDEIHVRGLLGLPSRTVDEIQQEQDERDELAKEIAKGTGQDGGDDNEDGEDGGGDGGDDTPNPPDESKDDQEKSKQDGQKNSAKYEEAIVPTKREQEFVEGITKFEDYLDGKYKEYDVMLTQAENKYRSFLTSVYKKADKENKDGVMVIADTDENKKLVRAAEKGIDMITEEMLRKPFVDSKLQEELFTVTQKAALTNINHLANTELADVVPSGFDAFDDYDYNNFGKYDAFDDLKPNVLEQTKQAFVTGAIVGGFAIGYVSNMLGVFFNEPRRFKENLSMNFASQVSVDLAVKQAAGAAFNRNVFKLSAITHARALYNAMLYSAGQKGGAAYYKVLVPSNRMKDVDPSGIIAKTLFGIYTANELNNIMNNRSNGSNTSAVNGLGLNYNSFEYYMPITEEEYETEKEISKQQRKELDLK